MWQPDAQKQLEAMREEILSLEARIWHECLALWETRYCNRVALGDYYVVESMDAILRAKVKSYELKPRENLA